jgi:hypothetical protein
LPVRPCRDAGSGGHRSRADRHLAVNVASRRRRLPRGRRRADIGRLTPLVARRQLCPAPAARGGPRSLPPYAPAAGFRHAYLDDAVAVLLHPYAQAAGLNRSGPFNLGRPDDYRVPDRGFHRQLLDVVYLDTAAVVVEIVSPDDETYEKLPFHAAHAVDEVVVVEPDERRVRIFGRDGDAYVDSTASLLLGVEADALTAAITWP